MDADLRRAKGQVAGIIEWVQPRYNLRQMSKKQLLASSCQASSQGRNKTKTKRLSHSRSTASRDRFTLTALIDGKQGLGHRNHRAGATPLQPTPIAGKALQQQIEATLSG